MALRVQPAGLTRQEAGERLERYGPNAIAQHKRNPLLDLALHFWGPVPWVLEATLVLTFLGHRYGDAVAVAFLLAFNAVVASVQEGRARDAVDLLRSRVVVRARVKRDGAWGVLPAEALVPGDLVHLGVGDIVPADAAIAGGTVEVDQSVLTGESAPKALQERDVAYAGTLVTRGDATAVVTATGTRTTYGKTAELVRTAKSTGELERVVLRIVSILTAVSAAVIAIIGFFAIRYGFGTVDVVVFAAMILLASVPIALPAAFTLATTLGSMELVRRGAIITRLSALEDAAGMDVLCTDKTGTITQNRIVVQGCSAFAPFTPNEVAAFAAAASDAAGQDPIDLAMLQYAAAGEAAVTRTSFTPFDPLTKYSSARVAGSRAATVYKGAPPVLRSMASAVPTNFDSEFARLASSGARVIAVALERGEHTEIAGLFALADPPRDDAAPLVRRLGEIGVRTMLLTGDTPATAASVARQVGIPPERVRASVYPADKLRTINDLQRAGSVVGMTGDGVNDAPALRQANIGIAVSNATDVAKAAAGIVLTQPGLANIVTAIEVSRAIFERMVTYTMMKLVKYFEIIGVLTVAFFVTRQFLLTPELLVALLILNDFVTLSVSTDNASSSQALRVWRVGRLIAAAVPIALVTAIAVLAAGAYALELRHVTIAQLRGVVFFSLVVMGQISVYVVRGRGTAWGVAPSRWLVGASVFAVVAVAIMAAFGLLMPRIQADLIAASFAILLAAGGIMLLGKAALIQAARVSSRSKLRY